MLITHGEGMHLLAEVIKWEIQIFILALGGLIALKLLTGEINTSRLFYGRISGRKRNQDQYFSPERIQLLIFTIGAALYYLTLVLDNPNPGTFPPIPQSWSAVVGGSNAIYLGGKAYARWIAQKL
jgi:hypothetical protein